MPKKQRVQCITRQDGSEFVSFVDGDEEEETKHEEKQEAKKELKNSEK